MYDAIAHYYDLTHADLVEDIPFLQAQVKAAGTHVLELGCGSGRLLPHLAKVSQFVVGVDNSAAMLALAATRCKKLPILLMERIHLQEADMSQLNMPFLHGTFHLIVVPYNTFLHLDTAQAAQMLKGLRPYFAKDGRLLIDVSNPFFMADTPTDPTLLLEKSFTDPENEQTVLQFAANRLDEEKQILQISWIFDATPTEGGSVHRTVSVMDYHYRFPHQLQLLLQETGYALQEMMGNYEGDPFAEDAPRLIMRAKVVG